MSEKRRAKRINVSLQIQIEQVSLGGLPDPMKWEDMASLKNISHLGAYFECEDCEQLKSGDILGINLDVNFPVKRNCIRISEQLPLKGLARIVRTERLQRGSTLGIGVQFLEPLSISGIN